MAARTHDAPLVRPMVPNGEGAGVAATLLLAGIARATGHATMPALRNQVNETCL